MYKIHIIPGWSEAGYQKNLFSRALDKGLQLTEDAASADVLVAHSAGCYALPGRSRAKLILLIGLPYWPGRPLISSIIHNALLDMPMQVSSWGVLFWLKLRLHNWVYGFAHPVHHIKIWRSSRKALDLASAGAKVVVIRNEQDVFCGPETEKYLEKFNKVEYIQLPGLHEDCWRFPEQYVTLIKKVI